jgi:gamma-glutamyltranspeptidase/glutathione hydrolase
MLRWTMGWGWRRGTVVLGMFCLVGLGPPGWGDEFERHAVVSVEAHASEIGREVLRTDGNAVDAAIATAFALAVTYPAAGNLGGGGFLVAYLAGSGQVTSFDFRETAPAAATERMYLDAEGELLPGHRAGPRAAGVPGTVRGLGLAHERLGSRPWAELVRPAARLARSGFPISASLARSLNTQLGSESPLLGQSKPHPSSEARLADFPASFRAFSKPDRTPWLPGDLLVQTELADTLDRIAEQGPDEFYSGRTAELIAADAEAGGGLIRRGDLAAYRARERNPVHFTFRGHDVYSVAPPSSGGVVLALELQMLERFDLRADGPRHPRTVHRVTEAMRRAFFIRAMELGDPDFQAIPLERLTSAAYAAEFARGIGERATPSASLGASPKAEDGGPHTTHLSVVDREGNAVALTYTLEDGYGSKSVVAGAGFLLNNEMGDFNLIPGRTDEHGGIGTAPNRIAPGKRMLSSQTPTIVLRDGRARLVTGSPGGRTIPNTVLWVVLEVVEFDQQLEAALEAPRSHHAWFPDEILLENRGWPVGLLETLEQWGHRVLIRSAQGEAHSIAIDLKTRRIHAVADPRCPTGRAAGD